MQYPFKYIILVFILMTLLSSTCVDPFTVYITEVSGTVNNTEDCKSEFLYIYADKRMGGRAADSFLISADGSYYAVFSGAELIELRGNEFCGSDYLVIDRGHRRNHDFSFKTLRSGIELNVFPNRIDSKIKTLRIKLIRMIDAGDNNMVSLSNDIHNVNIQLIEPFDSLIKLTLVDQQFYHISILGLDSLNKTTTLLADTIKVNAQLKEILF